MSGSFKILIYGEATECQSAAEVMQTCSWGDLAQPEYREVFDHEELLQELIQWRPALIVVLINGAAGMEGVYAVKDNHPHASVFWFSDDHNFGMMSHRLGCAYFSVKPLSKEKIHRALRRCAHVGISL